MPSRPARASHSAGVASSEEELILLALFGEEAEPLLHNIRARASGEDTLVGGAVDETRAERIRDLVRVVQESGVAEITVEEGDLRVTVRRTTPLVTAAIANERREKPRTNARNRTRMLVIDDSATIVALLSRMLRQNDYEVFEAADAESGLELARAHRRRGRLLGVIVTEHVEDPVNEEQRDLVVDRARMGRCLPRRKEKGTGSRRLTGSSGASDSPAGPKTTGRCPAPRPAPPPSGCRSRSSR